MMAQLGRQQGLLDPNVAAEKNIASLPHMNPALAKSLGNAARSSI